MRPRHHAQDRCSSTSTRGTAGAYTGVDDTELSDVLADLDISPGKPVHKVELDAARVWTTVAEDEEGCSRGSATG